MSQNDGILSTKRPRSKADEARYWRSRAKEVRKVEGLFADASSRAKLEEIATYYDQMAEELEMAPGSRSPR
jgi:flagellar hook-associated protein FlgK